MVTSNLFSIFFLDFIPGLNRSSRLQESVSLGAVGQIFRVQTDQVYARIQQRVGKYLVNKM